jgi:pimeloyl-ACP methyl ester carboxylesterase
MTISEQILDSDARFLRHGEGALAVVFVHGFLDDQHVWDKVIDELKTPGIETIRLDLAGLGDRANASGPFTYERLADDVGAVIDRVGKPFVMSVSATEAFAADQTVFHDREHPSHVILPVVPR